MERTYCDRCKREIKRSGMKNGVKPGYQIDINDWAEGELPHYSFSVDLCLDCAKEFVKFMEREGQK
jgi:hypothetical protein